MAVLHPPWPCRAAEGSGRCDLTHARSLVGPHPRAVPCRASATRGPLSGLGHARLAEVWAGATSPTRGPLPGRATCARGGVSLDRRRPRASGGAGPCLPYETPGSGAPRRPVAGPRKPGRWGHARRSVAGPLGGGAARRPVAGPSGAREVGPRAAAGGGTPGRRGRVAVGGGTACDPTVGGGTVSGRLGCCRTCRTGSPRKPAPARRGCSSRTGRSAPRARRSAGRPAR